MTEPPRVTCSPDQVLRAMDRSIEYLQMDIENLESQLTAQTAKLATLKAARETQELVFAEMPTLGMTFDVPAGNTPEPAAPAAPRKSRRDMVIEYLRQHGGARREDLVDKLGIPRGTLAGILKNDDTFEPVGNGHWMIRKPKPAKEDASEEKPAGAA